MRIENPLSFDQVRDVFSQENPAPAFRSTDYALRLLGAADRQFGDWLRVVLSLEDILGVMLPPHRHDGLELIPPSGSTVSEAVRKVRLVPQSYICPQKIEALSREPIYVGGLYERGKTLLIDQLNADLSVVGIAAVDAARASGGEGIAGLSRQNLTNRGVRGQGVQLEFSEGARRVFFPDLDSREGREHPSPHLALLTTSVERALAQLVVKNRRATGRAPS